MIGGVIDVASTKIIARNAYNLFIKNMIPADDSKENDDIFEAEFCDITDDIPESDNPENEE